MKLQNYIVEEEKGLAHYIPKIQAECKPFLKDIKNAAGTLFRDDTKNRNKPVWKKTTRMDRAPLDSSLDFHKQADDLFLKKFGWKARSQGLFCWPLPFKSSFLANKWMVFPAGNYKYLWSPAISDLWGDVGMNWEDTDYAIFELEESYLNTYKTDKIKMSIKHENEIMIQCKYSYLVKSELMEPINEALGLNWQGAVFKGRKI